MNLNQIGLKGEWEFMSLNPKDKQAIDGNQNTQINSGKDTIAAIGEKSVAVSGDYIFQSNVDEMRLSKINSDVEGLVRGQDEIFSLLESIGLNKDLLASKEVDIDQILYHSQGKTTENTFEELYFLQANSIQSLNYQETLDYQFMMFEISEREQDIIAEYWARVCLMNTSWLFEGPHFPVIEAINICQKAIELATGNDLPRMELDALTLMRGIYFRKKEFENTISTTMRCLPLSIILQDTEYTCSLLCGLSQVYGIIGRIKDARRELELAENILIRYDSHPIRVMETLTAKAIILMKELEMDPNLVPEETETKLSQLSLQFVNHMNSNRMPHMGPERFLEEIKNLIS